MEDVGRPRFTGAQAVIVARAMGEPANKASAGMQSLTGAQWIRDLKAQGIRSLWPLVNAAINVPWRLAGPQR
jgi:hypothetical protein